ncbi:hypothetical protein [Enterococcus pallens]|uniref:Uncharacterized protein n=1 Tax=Enterococcus pallens ATCC BAA-351 TaxID=1158607 RepID=R2SIF4_9ENTE|nr:hypothetical protein [Enterococcus pallens]EOH87959.1 hypothetical protein UAU_04814 [Enterococcus pallens ATCC BAA-351]EOU18173.1 hypothetical protein I588_03162 [Enterococcus pallens ATCC BAA-351]OJG82206.1 hypothetical protein RV10_GL000027 [Enterococcus pallens]
MAGFDFFVVALCGLCGVITEYSGLLFYREREFAYLMLGLCSGLVSVSIYSYYFAGKEILVCTYLYLAFWIVSGLILIWKAKYSRVKNT